MILNQFILLSMLEATKTCVLSYILKKHGRCKNTSFAGKGKNL